MLKNGRKPARKMTRCSSCKSTMRANSRLRWSINAACAERRAVSGYGRLYQPAARIDCRRNQRADSAIRTNRENYRTGRVFRCDKFTRTAISSANSSSHHNRRQDQWGGSLENRMRFLLEIYTAIRAAVGKDFLVGVNSIRRTSKGGLTKANRCKWYKNCRKWALILLKFPVATTKAHKC